VDRLHRGRPGPGSNRQRPTDGPEPTALTRSPAVDRLHRGRHAPPTDHPTTKTPTSWSKNARTELPRRRPRRGRNQYRSPTCIVRTNRSARTSLSRSRRVPSRRLAEHVTDSTQWPSLHVAAPKPSSSSRPRHRADHVVAVVLPESLSVPLPRDSRWKSSPPTAPRTGTNPPVLGGSRANDSPFRRVFPPSSRL